MREQHLQTIREAVIKANPDILKLEFGCEVRLEVKNHDIVYGQILYKRTNLGHGTDTDHWKILSGEGDVLSWNVGREGMTILGRPIRLSDVLVAISSGYGKHAVDDVGCFWEINSGEATITTNKRVEWNLRQDRLEDQSEECLAFLATLLAVKE